MNPTQTQLDPDAVNLAKAIRQHESGGNFNATGKSGETGAYQFTAPTWKGYAKEVLGDSNAPMTPENQNQVAYTKIKQWKDGGKNVGQIASMWNAGEGKPNAYLENNVGVNKYGVNYDTPAYAKKVAEIYQQLKGTTQSPQNPQDTSKQQEQQNEPNLGEQIGQRAQDVGTSIGKAGTGAVQLLSGQPGEGAKNVFGGLLQGAGAIAGGIGDITGKALELIPGVKQVENLLGQGIGTLAKTDAGKSVVKSINDFSTQHPELSKDIGAGFNIVTAIPILKGLGAIKNVALDATSSALKNLAEKSMTNDLTETVGRTVAGKKLLAQGGENYVKTLIDERAIPEIVNGKYSTKDAFSKLNQGIKNIDNNIYQPLLDKASYSGSVQTSFVPLEDIKQSAIKLAQSELKDTAPIEKYFERLKIKYGDYPPINEINKAKRIVSKNITEAGFASQTYSADEIVRKSLQTAVEDGAKALGIPNIDAINQQMAGLIKAQKVLKQIEGKSVKTGLVKGLIQNTATVGGEIAGTATGIPIAGTLTGRQAGGYVGNKLSNVSQGILKRTGKDAVRLSKEELAKKLGGLFGGVASQKITNQK